jgi:CheY-like chemotaxis protein
MKTQPGCKRLIAVVLTSSKQSPDINRAYDLGANSYLVKPSSPDDLLNLLKRLGAYWLLHNVSGECQPCGSPPASAVNS